MQLTRTVIGYQMSDCILNYLYSKALNNVSTKFAKFHSLVQTYFNNVHFEMSYV
jgi:hypothetical protein